MTMSDFQRCGKQAKSPKVPLTVVLQPPLSGASGGGYIPKLSVVLSLRGALRQAQDKLRDEAISFGQVRRLLRSLWSLAMTDCTAFTDGSGIYALDEFTLTLRLSSVIMNNRNNSKH